MTDFNLASLQAILATTTDPGTQLALIERLGEDAADVTLVSPLTGPAALAAQAGSPKLAAWAAKSTDDVDALVGIWNTTRRQAVFTAVLSNRAIDVRALARLRDRPVAGVENRNRATRLARLSAPASRPEPPTMLTFVLSHIAPDDLPDRLAALTTLELVRLADQVRESKRNVSPTSGVPVLVREAARRGVVALRRVLGALGQDDPNAARQPVAWAFRELSWLSTLTSSALLHLVDQVRALPSSVGQKEIAQAFRVECPLEQMSPEVYRVLAPHYPVMRMFANLAVPLPWFTELLGLLDPTSPDDTLVAYPVMGSAAALAAFLDHFSPLVDRRAVPTEVYAALRKIPTSDYPLVERFVEATAYESRVLRGIHTASHSLEPRPEWLIGVIERGAVTIGALGSSVQPTNPTSVTILIEHLPGYAAAALTEEWVRPAPRRVLAALLAAFGSRTLAAMQMLVTTRAPLSEVRVALADLDALEDPRAVLAHA